MPEPGLEGRGVGRRLGVDDRRRALQLAERPVLEFADLSAGDESLHAVAGGVASLGCQQILRHGLDQFVAGAGLRGRQLLGLGPAFPDRREEADGIGGGDGEARQKRALQQGLPLVGGKIALGRHILVSTVETISARHRAEAIVCRPCEKHSGAVNLGRGEGECKAGRGGEPACIYAKRQRPASAHKSM